MTRWRRRYKYKFAEPLTCQGVTLKAYRVSGKFLMGRRREERPFSKEVAALDMDRAKEIIICEFGSKHRTKHKDVTISSVQELKPEEVNDQAIKQKLGRD